MPDTTDRVAGYLAGVGERSERPVRHPSALPISNEDVRGLMESAADVPCLLKAVEAALARHQRADKPVRWWDLDLRCPAHDWTKSIVRGFGVVRDCPDCTYREVWHCANPGCREEPWPCPDRRDIEAALLGEESDHG